MTGVMVKKSQVLVTFDDVSTWERRLQEVLAESERLAAEATELRELIKAANLLAGARANTPPPLVGPKAETSPPVTASTSSMTYVEAVLGGIADEGLGVTFQGLREKLLASDFGDKLRASDKGFYHAITRLEKRGAIVRHKSRFFSPDNFEAYKKRVAQGLVEELVTPDRFRGSNHTDAVLEIIASTPGINAVAIIATLEKDPRFSVVNKNTVYNLIARQIKRGVILKKRRGLYSAPQRKDPPTSNEDDGSKPGAKDDLQSSLALMSHPHPHRVN